MRENGITHRLTGVRAPTTTGKVERFHKTLRKELLATLPPLPSAEVAQQVLDAWVEDYNQRRPHQALGGQTPAERFHAKPDPDHPDQDAGVCCRCGCQPPWAPSASGCRQPSRSESRRHRPPRRTGRDQPNGAAAGGRRAGAGVREPGGGRPAGLAGPAAGRPDGPGATGRGHHARQPGRPSAQDPAVPAATKGPGPRPAGGRPTGRASSGQRGRPRGAGLR